MDIVYPLKKETGAADELRYSLRSLGNLPHDKVFVAGGFPGWTSGVLHIPAPKGRTKYLDSTANVKAACESPLVSDPFVLFNDDFFVLSPAEEVPTLNRGKVTAVLAAYRGGNNNYRSGMSQTLDRLAALGYPDPWSFELHLPLVVHKQMMLAALQAGINVPVWHKRTAYGCLAGLEGRTTSDVKIHDLTTVPTGTFVSTSDKSFRLGRAGREIRNMFNRRCLYEA
jgi:hypothetical protein